MTSNNSDDVPTQPSATSGPSRPVEPELISAPSLTLSFLMHTARMDRLWSEDEDDPGVVMWSYIYEELTRDILKARAIVGEIRTGLVDLGILESSPEPRTFAEHAALENLLRDLIPSLALDEEFPDPHHRRVLFQALNLVRVFARVRGEWLVDEYHLFAERVADWDDEIRDVTMDEWELSCPDIPAVDGLRDWNDISDEAWDEGWPFDGSVLVEECGKVLAELVDLMVTRSRQTHR